MTNGHDRPGPQMDPGPLIAGTVLIGIGSVISLTGVAVTAAALAAVARRWVSEMEVPPRELLRQQIAKAKAATAAGASAWRDGGPAPQRRRT